MIKNYQNDNSFFTVVVPKMCVYYAWPVYRWLFKSEPARFRLIQDKEIEEKRLGIKEVDEIYPGIKIIGVVMNPYARVIYKLHKILEEEHGELGIVDQNIKEMFDTGKVPPMLNQLVSEIAETGTTSLNVSSAMLKSQLSWLSYQSPDGYHQADYIIRGEHGEEDIKPLVDYFRLEYDTPFSMGIPSVEYRQYYTDEIHNLISKLYETDIKTLGYEF